MPCLFCGSPEIVPASFPRPTRFNDKIFSYKKCQSCGLVFIDPIPTDDDYAKMYAVSYHDQFYFKNLGSDFDYLVNTLSAFIKEKSIVDYGCGDASVLKYFAKAGYRCVGVEYNPELVKKLKEQNPGITFYTVDEFWKAGPELKFSSIFFGDVLEHLPKPADFLRTLYDKMSPGGLLMAQGPLENNTTLGLVFRKLTSSLVPESKKVAGHTPYHITFSTARNQEGLFKRSGFHTLHYRLLESPWPFPEKFSKHPVRAVQFLIGKTSVAMSKIAPGKLGNRFVYIGRKEESADGKQGL